MQSNPTESDDLKSFDLHHGLKDLFTSGLIAGLAGLVRRVARTVHKGLQPMNNIPYRNIGILNWLQI